MTVRDRDNGAAAMVRRLRGRYRVKVGIIGAEASEQKEVREGDPPALTVADVATFHEFGLGVPRRSFIRDYVDENDRELQRRLYAAAANVGSGKVPVRQALDQFGLYVQGAIQERIARHIPPPLAEVTKERKGSSTPLIDTGQLRSSITYAVEEQGDNG